MALYATPRRLADALPGQTSPTASATPVIGVLPGEGVGPEVVDIALNVLAALCTVTGRQFDLRFGGVIGNDAIRATGKCLSDEVIGFCDEIFAASGVLFCGAGGARFVYDLRERYNLFCKFTILKPQPALHDCGVLRPEGLDGIDIIAVRENIGGLYFGEWGQRENAAGELTAYHHFSYRRHEVDRILLVAAKLAASRRGKLCVVIKRDGTPAISALWLDRVADLAKTMQLEIEVLDIDNAVYQLIAGPSRFDVLVSPNLFGDILADCGSLLLGSRGMSYSGNFDDTGRAAYQTGHGAAYDLAGTGSANPVGQVLSLAMLLEESFCWSEGAAIIRGAVANVLEAGIRTADIAGPGAKIVGAREFGKHLTAAVAAKCVTASS